MTKHEKSTAPKTKLLKKGSHFALKLSRCNYHTNKYQNANFCWVFNIFKQDKFMFSQVSIIYVR